MEYSIMQKFDMTGANRNENLAKLKQSWWTVVVIRSGKKDGFCAG